jgi:nucleotide-binding universal stress UspA family protein
MTPTATVLVLVDGSSNATSALPVARGLAHLLGATVALVHIGREAVPPGELAARLGLSPDDVREVVINQSTGSPADVIAGAAAAGHTALVVTTAPAAPDRSSAFEGVPRAVLRAAPWPVVLVPPSGGRRAWALRQLVLPHDGTPTSAAAIAQTADLASRAGAELVVLHVATPGVDRPSEPGSFAAPRYLDQPHHEWPVWEREFLERVRAAAHPRHIEQARLVLAQGEAGAAILEFARRHASDLIALAWRGSVESERAQTMRRVIRGAGCPVIVFRVQAG